MGGRRVIAVAEDDVELVRAVLAEGADVRARAAEAAAVMLEEERRAQPRKDLRSHHARIGRTLAEAGVLRALAVGEWDLEGAEPVGGESVPAPALPASRPVVPAPGPAVSLASPEDDAAGGVGVDGSGGVGVLGSAPDPGPVGAVAPTTEEEATTDSAQDPTVPVAGGTDFRLDGEGQVVAMSDRQRRRQALSDLLTRRRQDYVKGQVYALAPETVELIAAIEGYNVDPRADDGRDPDAWAGQPPASDAELAAAVGE